MALPSTFCLTTAIPGPPGATGAAGTNGTNGVNAYTFTSASFVMPAEGANVVVSVLNSDWMSNNQVLYVDFAGYMLVVSTPTSTSVTLQNLENTASGLYTGNAAPTTVVPNVSSVSPAGIQGPAGAAGAGGAPSTAGYWVRTADATLSSESDMSALATGYVKVTTGTGAPSSQAVPIPIADGGTNGITATAAFDNLAPTTTDGDIIIYNGTDNIRLATSGAATRYLSNTGTNNRPAWAQVDLTNGVTGVLPVANGGSAAAVATAFSCHRNGVDQGGINTGAPTAVNWTTALIANSYMDLTTDRYTPLTAGNYFLHASCVWEEGTFAGNETITISIYKNGAEVAQKQLVTINTFLTSQVLAVSTIQAANGTTDYFEVYVTQNSGGSQSIDGVATRTFFCGNKVA